MDNIETATQTSLWNKKAQDLTTSESLAFVGAISAVSVLVPLGMMALAMGGSVVYEKIQERRRAKQTKLEVVKTEKD